ncbi:MAG: class I SAM-dependent methyltransferase [Deltaproteobacteria bacterium]|nr:class I SAM-dependent methyltransferase [Deltaproteobacteria bacterium]MBZ0219894.1 class I SAM-dependent methyltransferase [Deltaproteobacteria bacterium]
MRAESASAFDLSATEYDSWYDSAQGRPVFESELKCLRSLMPENETPLLEIGVGTGRFAMYFPGAYGADPALGALKLAQKRGIRCVNGVGEQLPFRDGAFKTVLIIATLCFVKRPQSLLQEASRILSPDGDIIVGFISRSSSWGALYEKKKKEGSTFYRHAKFYDLPDIKGFAKAAGLCTTSIVSTLLQPPSCSSSVEEPRNSYVEGAGFIFLRLEKEKGLLGGQ